MIKESALGRNNTLHSHLLHSILVLCVHLACLITVCRVLHDMRMSKPAFGFFKLLEEF